jgi:predicted aldo/keto reductase-like oxidoreductase
MDYDSKPTLTRRSFVGRTGLVAGGLLYSANRAHGADETSSGDLPRRVLGRTGAAVSILTMGTGPCGMGKGISPQDIARIVNVAIDLGINSIDTAPAYQKAEEGVGLGLGRRRREVFLATKVAADTIEEAEGSLSNSLRLLKTDAVDLLYFHSLANRKIEGARDTEGVYHWLLKQKQAGKCRFVGVSGHHLPRLFPSFLEHGDVDVLMTMINFVDHHTYNFEDKVLPVARGQKMGIIAMKVFGGARAGAYANPDCPPHLDTEHMEMAVRYSLGVPGVATLNIGVHNEEQVRRNVEMVKNYKPLDDEERKRLDELGAGIAQKWGPHLGPVA